MVILVKGDLEEQEVMERGLLEENWSKERELMMTAFAKQVVGLILRAGLLKERKVLSLLPQ